MVWVRDVPGSEVSSVILKPVRSTGNVGGASGFFRGAVLSSVYCSFF